MNALKPAMTGSTWFTGPLTANPIPHSTPYPPAPISESSDPILPKWPFDKLASDIPRGLYEIHPASGDKATYNFVLYASALLFMNWDPSSNADQEIRNITCAFRDIVSQLFPEARIMILWSITAGVSTPELLKPLTCAPCIYIIMESDDQTAHWFTRLRSPGYRKAFYQIKALLFLFTQPTEPWIPLLNIINDYDVEPRRVIDYIVFRWTNHSIPSKPSKLKIYTLPFVQELPVSPTTFRALKQHIRKWSGDWEEEDEIRHVVSVPQVGYAWLDRLRREKDDIDSPGGPESWKYKSAHQFLVSLRKMAEAVCSRGRSVWFMVRPLDRRILSGSDGNVQFSHWGIMVSEMTRLQLDARMAELPLDLPGELGDLHELKNIHGRAEYRCTNYTVKLNIGATKLEYLGQTEMTDEALDKLGNDLILRDPNYKLLKNNCQVWVQGFVEKVCPEADIEKTIGEVLALPVFS